MPRPRSVAVVPPAELASARGLAYALWRPPGPARGAVIVLHGAGSAKESHYDFARALVAAGFAALVFDQRGHGESAGPMAGDPVRDVAAMGELVRARLGPGVPLALRGSSMGGLFAILAAGPVGARAVVAICPASPHGLARGVLAGRHGFGADAPALAGFLDGQDLGTTVQALEAPLLLLHADGDEIVPVEHSRELAGRMRVPGSRLVTVPGGHHRSIQHDSELQALSLRFLEGALAA
jgi:alpha-beta hydrolase superfamily lysophospholipase